MPRRLATSIAQRLSAEKRALPERLYPPRPRHTHESLPKRHQVRQNTPWLSSQLRCLAPVQNVTPFSILTGDSRHFQHRFGPGPITSSRLTTLRRLQTRILTKRLEKLREGPGFSGRTPGGPSTQWVGIHTDEIYFRDTARMACWSGLSARSLARHCLPRLCPRSPQRQNA
jgi:hypothetical protein